MSLGKAVFGLLTIGFGLASVKRGAGMIAGASRSGLGRAPTRKPRGTAATPTVSGPMRLQLKNVNTLKERVAHIQRLARKGKTDPKIYAWSRKVLTKKCGKNWCVAEKDTMAEIKALYEAQRGRVRYTSDPLGVDTYVNPRHTLAMQAADCFPEGTLFVTPQGFCAVEHIEVGDVVHDGTHWVKILETWERGPKEILAFELNNNSVLRLSTTHKVLRVPRGPGNDPRAGRYEDTEEVRAEELRPGDELLQPRGFEGYAADEMDLDDAFLTGAYLAEGCRPKDKKEISLAGVADGKGIRERLLGILDARGVPYRAYVRDIRFPTEAFPLALELGRIAIEKHLPHFMFGPRTTAAIVGAMEQGDGGWSTSGHNLVYSTISQTLALQYRVLQRMLGRSTSITRLVDHGGAGKNPIYRITVRAEHRLRPWARIRSITLEDERVPSYDVMTESGRVYLPEADVITRQCDDFAAFACASLESVGIKCKLKVIRTKDSPDPNHIYALAATSKRAPMKFIGFDTSIAKFAGWEPPASIVAEQWLFDI